MNYAHSTHQISYVSWVLGQIGAMVGIILVAIYGFDLVILQARWLYETNLGELAVAAEAWIPPFEPPLMGLGLTLLAWMVAHLQHLPVPVPVLVGALLNVVALSMAFAALTF